MKPFKQFVTLILIAGLSGSISKADFIFGEPTSIGSHGKNGNTEYSASISADGLALYFDEWQDGQTDIWVTTRTTTNDDWGEAVPLGSEVNSSSHEWTPRISADGLELYFASRRTGSFQIYVARRQNIHDDWQPAENLGPMINSSSEQTMGSISADGLELYYGTGSSYKSGNELRVATRPTKDSPWTETKVISSTIRGTYPAISPDGLHLVFSSDSLSGGMGDQDLWMMTWQTSEKTPEGDWGAPVNIGLPINSSGVDHRPWISYDGKAILFTYGYVGGYVRCAPILPVVDLNGDGIVDAQDMCMIVDHWGENYPLCDIGPAPMGDGIVDVQDLVVLAEHLFEEVP
ncbi:MAG: PD40 domain-containing protein [Sedimentisphaerales bacterium]|nr:PD40 domain-containing protein [Sedimentisphaerales bacterium]